MTLVKKSFSSLAQALVWALSASSTIAFADQHADGKSADEKTVDKQVEVISIFGQRNQLETATGSAFIVDQQALEQFEFDDIHRVLQSVPGVYLREEDGYGLRPNIGLRGATTERSSKVALMEDGILIAPAPYAAPAAYYFPLMSRMSQVEVFKGPSAIKYGPNTVGGAINMLSRQIVSTAEPAQGQLDLAYGEDNYQKAHGYYSGHHQATDLGTFGYLVEALTINSDGFKELDTGGNTGFHKNEFLAKVNFAPKNSDYYQLWQFKLGYSEEVSHESYLGLSDGDFQKTPYRRYAASQNDKMDWEHYQFQLSHYIELDGNTSIYTQAYRRDFDRDWDKFNNFNTNRSMQTILSSPDTGLNALFMEVLTGQRDSLTAQENLIFTLNDRQYYSQGIESKLLWDGRWLNADLALDIGLRLHQDQVDRHHRADQYLMRNQQLELAGVAQQTAIENKDTATAIASYINANLDFGDVNVTAGLRVEHINGEAKDKLIGTETDVTDTVVLPGFGVFYRINEQLGALFGVNKGYVPNSPGQETNIDPEESWNYEFGLRYSDNGLQAQMIGFFNDYTNLKGTCTFSSGCDQTLDQEFNGGAVEVFGIEANLNTEFVLSQSLTMPISIAYTYTDAEFQNEFQSYFSQWGHVQAGDPLPYLPENQLSIEIALAHENWRAALLFKHLDAMPEAAGYGTELEGMMTEQLQQLDFSAWYQVYPELKAYFKLDNVTDEAALVSRRPFGARSGKPRQAMVGVKYSF
ncbi:TonB-dependent receptor [Thalassotalea insulae]|uniref:TonB-dependent receptor n=1 Tax=Thalassotalea insulae TaxID=2056778 RepID=A0ABQ6GW47_9GAMM|nr:TonB-dependent receptor [Thalassotalea insulae]GLX78857.1 TonB-dependent receptor [Thalassotalea insulae]